MPNTSAIRPPASSRPANTRMYALAIHSSPEIDRCRSRWIDGSATLTTLLSRYVMKVASATATSATHLRLFPIPLPLAAVRRTCTSYLYDVHRSGHMRPCTLYSCQVGNDRLGKGSLSKATVAEHALKLADTEGLDSVTIRRLAQELGVTPMALYWHFKNKDELLLGIADHVLAGVKATREPGDPWLGQLRAMLEALVGVMRAHPSLHALLQTVDKQAVTSFTRATNDALELLGRGGLGLEESHWARRTCCTGPSAWSPRSPAARP